MKNQIVDSPAWIEDSLKWRGKTLTGQYSHWCFDWDFLPVDETCDEWPCPCAKEFLTDQGREDSE